MCKIIPLLQACLSLFYLLNIIINIMFSSFLMVHPILKLIPKSLHNYYIRVVVMGLELLYIWRNYYYYCFIIIFLLLFFLIKPYNWSIYNILIPFIVFKLKCHWKNAPFCLLFYWLDNYLVTELPFGVYLQILMGSHKVNYFLQVWTGLNKFVTGNTFCSHWEIQINTYNN